MYFAGSARRYALWLALACSACSAAVHAAAPAPSPSGPAATGEVIGLAVTTFRLAHFTGAGDCPSGLAEAPRNIYLGKLPPAERERLSSTARDDELQLLQSQGRDGVNICNSPTAG